MLKAITASKFLVLGFSSNAYALSSAKTLSTATLSTPTLPTPTLPTLPPLTVPTLPSVGLQGSTLPTLTAPTLVVPTLTAPTLPPLPTLTPATLPKVTLPVSSGSVTVNNGGNGDEDNSDEGTSTLTVPVLVATPVVMPQLPALVVPTLPPLPVPVTVPPKKVKPQDTQSPTVASPSLSVATPQDLLDILNANAATPELVLPQNAQRDDTSPIRYLPYGAAGLSAYLGYRLLRKPKVVS